MKFSSYGEASQLMRDTALLNNLTPANPEAKKVLTYINSQIQFMGYSEALDFLRSNKG
jgi:hypothetical protein